MPSNREIVTEAFAAWVNGTGYVTSIFADDDTWEITGRSASSRSTRPPVQLVDEVLQPFGARFMLRRSRFPSRHHQGRLPDDEEQGTVIVRLGRPGPSTSGHLALTRTATSGS